MTLIRLTAALAAALLLLASCARGPEEKPGELEVLQAVGEQISRRRKPAPPAAPLTRALLDQQPQNYIEVTIENRDAKAYLVRVLERRDSHPGTIEVWRTQDNVSLAFRQGMVIATRGLGGGLLSAEVPAAEGVGGPARGGARRYSLRADGNGQRVVAMACRLQDLGPETVEIVEITRPVRHLQEYCEGAGGVVVNDYWVDSRPGRTLVWQSRQWAGAETGYVRIRHLQR
ncbi:YjbF family lipoprotein (plasmid) [Leisingera sp. S132]|uniref:YjbF family lipoprotein n=1 Tax=Leisingera sp. S132 TaxID=2867016 RepID=UPI0021A732BA|nr:YjbF family lipoprotein [Leisingera sp. S132]UWQ81902.1 YjbF family lipoprotein [Leisingera sp. S132]